MFLFDKIDSDCSYTADNKEHIRHHIGPRLRVLATIVRTLTSDEEH